MTGTNDRLIFYDVPWQAFFNLPFPFATFCFHLELVVSILLNEIRKCCKNSYVSNLLSSSKTWCIWCNTGMEFLGHCYCSWIFGSDPASIWQYKRFKRVSWKVITILETWEIFILFSLQLIFISFKWNPHFFFPCRCLNVRKDLLPGDHIQVCSLTGILVVPTSYSI